jgi:hypothetical protein
MSDAFSVGNAFEGNTTPQIDLPQVGVGPDTDRVGPGVLAPKHPHWRNDPTQKARHDGLASVRGELSRIAAAHGGAALAPAARAHVRCALALGPRAAAPVLALACVFRCAGFMQRNRNGLPAAPDLAGPAAGAAFELAVLELVHHAAQRFSLSRI